MKRKQLFLYPDLEPRLSYKSKKYRNRMKTLKWVLIVLVILVVIIFAFERSVSAYNCVKSPDKGYVERYKCGVDNCCETLTIN